MASRGITGRLRADCPYTVTGPAVSQPRISRLVAALEREVGGKLFERTSRRVVLTPLGEQFHALLPGYAQMQAALARARHAVRDAAGLLRIECLVTLAGPALTRLIDQFSVRCPDCQVSLRVVETRNPYAALRRADIDVLVSYLVVNQPDLTAGSAIEHRDRALLVRCGHRLAGARSVSVEDLGDEKVHQNAPGFPPELYDVIVPSAAPSGRPIRRTCPWRDDEDVFLAVARGQIAHPSFAGMPLATRPDIVRIPIRGLLPFAGRVDLANRAPQRPHPRSCRHRPLQIPGNPGFRAAHEMP